MFRIDVLGSSSKGNCIVVDTGDVRFLLDCGLSLKQTKQKLHNLGIPLSSIDYAFITHEHIDHVRCLKQLVDQYDIKVISSRGTLRKLEVPKSNILYIKDGETVKIKNLIVKAKKVNHDAAEPLCFSIENTLSEKLLYLTDCGLARYLKFKDHDVYIVEANYSREQLELNYITKKIHKVRYERALSGMGHLSIDETIDFLKSNKTKNTQAIVLSHLSYENSNKEAFLLKAKNELLFEGIFIAESGLAIECGIDSQPF